MFLFTPILLTKTFHPFPVPIARAFFVLPRKPSSTRCPDRSTFFAPVIFLGPGSLPSQERKVHMERESKREWFQGTYMSIARVAVEEGGGPLGWRAAPRLFAHK